MKKTLFFTAIFSTFLIVGCQNEKADYTTIVERELASGERYDELFMDLELGMTKEDFFAKCWELNKQQIIRQGYSNKTVYYKTDELRFPAAIYFYPEFIDDKIARMPVGVQYLAWSPWNKSMSADSLVLDVYHMLEKWYGEEGYFVTTLSAEGKVICKVDGNRRITLKKSPDNTAVDLIYTDLSVIQDLEKQPTQTLEKPDEIGEEEEENSDK